MRESNQGFRFVRLVACQYTRLSLCEERPPLFSTPWRIKGLVSLHVQVRCQTSPLPCLPDSQGWKQVRGWSGAL